MLWNSLSEPSIPTPASKGSPDILNEGKQVFAYLFRPSKNLSIIIYSTFML